MENDSEKDVVHILEQRLEKMNERLMEVEQTRTLFISNMLNEVNNPLTAILGLTKQIMSVQKPDWDSVTETVSWINEEAMFLEFQLRNIFAAAEFEAGTMELELAKVNLNNVWTSVTTPYVNTIHRKHLKVLTNGDYMLPPSINGKIIFRTDARLISLLLMNLLDNAIKIAPDHSTINVTCQPNTDSLTISIQDEGAGISQEDQDKVFDRFRQLDSSTTKQLRGMGLGLSLVSEVCDILGGTVEITSEVGKGATFTVTVPESEEGEYLEANTDNLVFFEDDELGEEESF